MDEEFEICKNCKHQIARTNFVIHSVHCERNIQLCLICSEPVPKIEMEKHMEESHTMDICPFCTMPMGKWLLEAHKNTCSKRPTSCNFCQLEFPMDYFEEHVAICGSRTEKCTICKNYIILQHLEKHKQSCLKEKMHMNSNVCQFCQKEFPLNIFKDHVSVCKLKISRCPNCNENIMNQFKKEHSCQKASRCPSLNENIMHSNKEDICQKEIVQINSKLCQFCLKKIPLDIFHDHIFNCKLRISRDSKCNEFAMFKDKENHSYQKVATNITSICPYCKKEILLKFLLDHIDVCGSQIKKCSKCDEPVMLMDKAEHICKMQSGYCEFCNDKFPALVYAAHVKECSKRPYKCELCLKIITFGSKDSHAKHQCTVTDDNSTNAIKCEDMTYPATDHKSDEFPEQNRECEFCKKKMKTSFYSTHKDICPERPYKCELCLESISYKNKENHLSYECKMIHMTEIDYPGKSSMSKRSTTRATDENSDMPLDPCKFCGERLPYDHMVTCSACCYECRDCSEKMPLKNREKHECKSICCKNQKRAKKYISDQSHASITECSENYSKNCWKENNPRKCEFCHYDLPSAKYDEHIKLCAVQVKECKFCNEIIPIMEEDSHLIECVKPWKDTSKKGRRKNKKKDTSEISRGAFDFRPAQLNSRNENLTRHNRGKEYISKEEITDIPCEFCHKLWPWELIVEHQSGCCPDVVHYPKNKSLEPRSFQEIDQKNVGVTRPDVIESLSFTTDTTFWNPETEKRDINPHPPSKDNQEDNQIESSQKINEDLKNSSFKNSNEYSRKEIQNEQKTSSLLYKFNASTCSKDVSGKAANKKFSNRQSHDSSILPGDFLQHYTSPDQVVYGIPICEEDNSEKCVAPSESHHPLLNPAIHSYKSPFNLEQKAIGSERAEKREMIQIINNFGIDLNVCNNEGKEEAIYVPEELSTEADERNNILPLDDFITGACCNSEFSNPNVLSDEEEADLKNNETFGFESRREKNISISKQKSIVDIKESSQNNNAIENMDLLNKDIDLEVYMQFLADKQDYIHGSNDIKTECSDEAGNGSSYHNERIFCSSKNQQIATPEDCRLSKFASDDTASKGARSKFGYEPSPELEETQAEDLQLMYERNASSNIRRENRNRMSDVSPHDMRSKEEMDNQLNWNEVERKIALQAKSPFEQLIAKIKQTKI